MGYKKAAKNRTFSFIRLLRWFTPMFIIAAGIPWLCMNIVQSSEAGISPELRIWTEPVEVTATRNQSIMLEVYAEFTDPTQFIPGISFETTADSQLRLKNQKITTNKVFRGRTLIGTIAVTGTQEGSYRITIPQQLVKTSLPTPLAILTHDTVIHIKK